MSESSRLAEASKGGGKATSQTVKALLALRDLILTGELKRGERIAELAVVDRLGVSRTPLRMALVRLEEEGLLEALPSGGFVVKAFTERDIFDAIEARGTMEGLAARFAAERGVTSAGLSALHRCLADLDDLIDGGSLSEDDFSNYVDLNEQFHNLIMEMADSPVLARQIERASALPFASPSGFVMAQAAAPEALKILTLAQDQHRCIVEAIEAREGARAEALMREHARLAKRNLVLALRDQGSFELVPGAALIRRRASA